MHTHAYIYIHTYKLLVQRYLSNTVQPRLLYASFVVSRIAIYFASLFTTCVETYIGQVVLDK